MINFILPLITNVKVVAVVVAMAAASLFSYKLASNLKQIEIEKLGKEYELYKSNSAKERAEMLARNQELEAKSSEVTVQVLTKYVNRVNVVKEKGEEIVREVPIYITKESDAKCVIPIGFVRVHDAATRGEKVPDSTGPANERPTDIKLSEATETITGNYGTCNQVREQLKSLQEWVKTQEQTFNKPNTK